MRYLSLLVLLLATSCAVQQKPISTTTTANNKDYKVQYLFEHEGCKVYRFADGSYYVYYTNCNGQAIARTDSTTVQNSTQVVH